MVFSKLARRRRYRHRRLGACRTKRELTTTQVNVNERKVWKKAERQLIDETPGGSGHCRDITVTV
jgi:hypothetical protein